MECIVKIDVAIDLQKAFDKLSRYQQMLFMKENIIRATNDILMQELLNRGYEISKG